MVRPDPRATGVAAESPPPHVMGGTRGLSSITCGETTGLCTAEGKRGTAGDRGSTGTEPAGTEAEEPFGEATVEMVRKELARASRGDERPGANVTDRPGARGPLPRAIADMGLGTTLGRRLRLV